MDEKLKNQECFHNHFAKTNPEMTLVIAMVFIQGVHIEKCKLSVKFVTCLGFFQVPKITCTEISLTKEIAFYQIPVLFCHFFSSTTSASFSLLLPCSYFEV